MLIGQKDLSLNVPKRYSWGTNAGHSESKAVTSQHPLPKPPPWLTATQDHSHTKINDKMEGARSAAASSSEVPPQGAEADDLSQLNILVTVTDTAAEREASQPLLAVRMDERTRTGGALCFRTCGYA